MENLEIKDVEVKEEKKPAKKKASPKKKEELSTRQIFMMQCNERRRAAGIKEMAYSEEEISKAK